MMGENGRNRGDDEMPSSLFPLDLADEMNLAMKACISSANHDENKELKRLGLERFVCLQVATQTYIVSNQVLTIYKPCRAACYGWYNAYHMTKAMGEMILNEIRQDVPVLILRPSVVESCYREPVPGWIQGNRFETTTTFLS